MGPESGQESEEKFEETCAPSVFLDHVYVLRGSGSGLGSIAVAHEGVELLVELLRRLHLLRAARWAGAGAGTPTRSAGGPCGAARVRPSASNVRYEGMLCV